MARPKIHDQALRADLIEHAGRLLSTEGPAALSMRRLAGDAGTSTTAVYSLFGGKPGLIREVFIEAFRRFGARLAEVPHTGDACADLIELGWAYRANALANPHLYAVMFGLARPDCETDEETEEVAGAAMGVLVDMVSRAMDAGVLREDDPEQIALAIWATVHGLVSLELNESLPHKTSEKDYEQALRAVVRGWSPERS